MQEIITKIIIAVCVVVAAYMFYKRLKGGRSKDCSCGCTADDGVKPHGNDAASCDTICGGCSLYDACRRPDRK